MREGEEGGEEGGGRRRSNERRSISVSSLSFSSLTRMQLFLYWTSTLLLLFSSPSAGDKFRMSCSVEIREKKGIFREGSRGRGGKRERKGGEGKRRREMSNCSYLLDIWILQSQWSSIFSQLLRYLARLRNKEMCEIGVKREGESTFFLSFFPSFSSFSSPLLLLSPISSFLFLFPYSHKRIGRPKTRVSQSFLFLCKFVHLATFASFLSYLFIPFGLFFIMDRRYIQYLRSLNGFYN